MIRIIIGANYGDEGKGRTTAYFSKQKTINVLTNGGAQRGHTVVYNGIRHVFHHFGSGSFKGAYTYLFRDFLIDPVVFLWELEELNKVGVIPITYRDENIKFVTPYDVIVNQEIEKHRKNKHGSCGMGIWETVLRYRAMSCWDVDAFIEANNSDKITYLKNMSRYAINRLKEEQVHIRDELYNILTSEILITRFIKDITMFYNLVEKKDLKEFNDIIFENAQGLLLNSNPNDIHTTPSETGCKRIVKYIEEHYKNKEVEIIYVTRPYLTRHGEGPFVEEVDRKELNANFDETNVYNEFQGYIRYGRLNKEELLQRINKDFKYASGNNKYYKSLSVTHLDELPLDISGFHKIYEFRGE